MHRIIFSMGPVTIYTYGLFVAVGVALAVILALRQSLKEGIRTSDMMDILTAMILGGLAGGRLLFVAINWKVYFEHPASIFDISEGGMAFQGALVLSLSAGAFLSFKRKISFWKISDILAPYLALAHSIGRIGCFFNGCCYGKPASGAFAVVFPGDPIPRIPAQLYSSAGLFLIFVFLSWLRGKKRFDGFLLSVYLMLYAVFRLFMDNFRGDELARIGEITLSQAISAVFFIAGLVLYATGRKRGKSLWISK